MTHQGPVFGEGVAFGELTLPQRTRIHTQMALVAGETAAGLTVTLLDALPEEDSEGVATHVRQIVPKAAAFVPALTAGELTEPADTHRLTLTARAVGYMYAADQLVDRGDAAMGYAIERYNNASYSAPPKLDPFIAARGTIMTAMENSIGELAGQDAPDIIPLYADTVLLNELRLQRLSTRYANFGQRSDNRNRLALGTDGQQSFLGIHARHIADRMVDDAGFQSVTASLHAAYKAHNQDLPTIAELHGDARVAGLIDVCNAVARVADERGDWWMDAGNDPKHGLFSINPFNQAHPRLIGRLCERAGITDPVDQTYLTEQFQGFAVTTDQAERDERGTIITNRFFLQMRSQVSQVEGSLPPEFSQYVTLIKRVGEICHVNMLGDIQMSGQA
jgi:hypothetical protein